MVRHIVMWNLREDFSASEKTAAAQKIKSTLEALPSTIEGIVSLSVKIESLPTGNREIMLDSLFVSEEALAAYVTHPDHVRAGDYIKTVVIDRASIDYAE